MEGLKRHGKQWKKVAAYVGTRTVTQTKTHAQKYFQKVQKVNTTWFSNKRYSHVRHAGVRACREAPGEAQESP